MRSAKPEANAVWATLMLTALRLELPDGLDQLFPPPRGLHARLVEHGQRLLEGDPAPGMPVSRALGLDPADPLAPALDALWGQAPPRAAEPAQSRGLLALSQALLLSGKTEEALAGLREVAHQGSPREELEAVLWMARAAARQGDLDGVRQTGGRARDLAREVGPQALARTGLDTGLLLAELQPEEAAPWLHEAAGQLAALGLEAEAARARLAQQFPREFVRSVSTAALSVDARRAAAECLSPSNPWHRVTLGSLAEDVEPAVRAAAAATLERRGGTVLPPLLRIQSLGPFEVFLGDEPVEDGAWKSQKTRYLLACLAGNRGQAVPEDRLIDFFWPDSPPERARRNLYTATSYLRAALKLTGWSGTLEFVVRSGPGLALNPRLPRWHDLEEFERLVAQARKSPPSQALECWRSALRLARGPYLDGCSLEWCSEPRRRLERELAEAMGEVARLSLAQGHPREGLELALRLLDTDPCHLEACQYAMQASSMLGRHAEAVRLFERLSRKLHSELGAEPPLPLVELYHRAKLEL